MNLGSQSEVVIVSLEQLFHVFLFLRSKPRQIEVLLVLKNLTNRERSLLKLLGYWFLRSTLRKRSLTGVRVTRPLPKDSQRDGGSLLSSSLFLVAFTFLASSLGGIFILVVVFVVLVLLLWLAFLLFFFLLLSPLASVLELLHLGLFFLLVLELFLLGLGQLLGLVLSILLEVLSLLKVSLNFFRGVYHLIN